MVRGLRVRLVVPVVLLVLIGGYCLVTAGDATLEPGRPMSDATRRTVVLDQRLVVLEEADVSGKPSIAEARGAIALAASFLATSGQATSVRASYATVTLRGEDGGVAWGIQSRQVWLVTFQDVGYPLSSPTAADCSCSAYYWRPHTVVVLDAGTGTLLVRLGVANVESD